MTLELEVRVAGIPALVRVDSARYDEPNPRADNPDDYRGGWSLDWSLCDRRGRPAPWLERRASPSDLSRVRAEIVRALEQEKSEC